MSTITNHINTYASTTAYDNDLNKEYPNVSYIEEDDIVLFEGEIGYEERYFTIKSLEDDNDIMFKLSATSGSPSTSSAKTISVSTDDGETWTDYTSTANGTTIATLNMGEKVLIKGNNDTYYNKSGWKSDFNYFTASKQIDVYGNIMSLIYGDDFKEQYSFPTGTANNFSRIFYNSTVVSAENLILPATTLTNYCYDNMFSGCTSLTTAPELTATTLAGGCYSHMFSQTNILPDCSNIDFTSETVASSGGLRGLFAGTKVTDSDLERILPKNANGKYCLPATTLAQSCYAYMFQDCSNLTTAPSLPATTLQQYCYNNMFNGCTSLTTAPSLPATILAQNCYFGMFEGCTSLTTAPALPATTLAQSCYVRMFYGCTSLTTAPVLPARTLVSNCYANMFNGCSNLNYIKAMFTTTPSTTYTTNWVDGVASSGTFVKYTSATWNVTGVNGVPSGWTIQKASS